MQNFKFRDGQQQYKNYMKTLKKNHEQDFSQQLLRFKLR